MIGFNGGLIGVANNVGQSTKLPGVWTSNEQCLAIARSLWPSTDPFSSSVSLLITGESGIVDTSFNSVSLTSVGSPSISTSIVKAGDKAISFNGSSYVQTPSSPLFGFGTGDFTIDFWIYRNTNVDGNPVDMRNGSNPSNTPNIGIASGGLVYYVNGLTRISGGSVTTATWHHIALCRSGTSTRLFLNGNQVGGTWSDSTNYINTNARIGASNDGGAIAYVNGVMDNVRITKGVARFTSSFTPSIIV